MSDIISALDILAHSPLIGRKAKGGDREPVIGRSSRGYVALYRFLSTGCSGALALAPWTPSTRA